MKIFYFFSFIALLLFSCKKEKTVTENNATPKSGNITSIIDITDSKVEWKGYKILKSDHTSHFGTLAFKSGTVEFVDGKVTGGKFIVDMNSLKNLDLESDAEQKTNLENHLKSSDFFDTENNPESNFVITKVSENPNNSDYNSVIQGNLTIKGKTNPVTFNANISTNDGFATIATEPTDISRDAYDIRFAIPLQNGVLNDNITLQIFIKTKAK